MLKEQSPDYLFLIIPIIMIILVGWIIYSIYIPMPADTYSQKMCTSDQNCSKQYLLKTSKDNITEAQKKLSTDLLQLIGSDNKTENQLVYVYITTRERADSALINQYIWNITNTDPANHLVVAWINVDNLTVLASLDSVQSIRTVTSPINR